MVDDLAGRGHTGGHADQTDRGGQGMLSALYPSLQLLCRSKIFVFFMTVKNQVSDRLCKFVVTVQGL